MVYRCGRLRMMCDGCYRLRPVEPGEGSLAEPLWRGHHEMAGFPSGVAMSTTPGGQPLLVVQPAQPRHLCPRCQAKGYA